MSPLLFTSNQLTPQFKQVPLVCSGHTRPVVFHAFSGCIEDNVTKYFLLSASKDGNPMLRQGETGDWIGTFEGHKGAVWGADLNKVATLAATGAADYSAKVWDAESGDEELDLAHNHIVKSVNFSDDSSLLATASTDKLVRVFDLQHSNNNGPKVTFSGHQGGVKQAIFNAPEGKRLVSCADDRTIRLWDIVSGREIKQVMFDSPIHGLELEYSTGSVLTVCHGNTVSFYHPHNLELIRSVYTPTIVYSASLLLENGIFVCGGEDFKVYKYNYLTGNEIESFKGHFGPVHCVRFSPDGELFASGAEDGTLRLWQTEVGKNYGLWQNIDTLASFDNDDLETTI